MARFSQASSLISRSSALSEPSSCSGPRIMLKQSKMGPTSGLNTWREAKVKTLIEKMLGKIYLKIQQQANIF